MLALCSRERYISKPSLFWAPKYFTFFNTTPLPSAPASRFNFMEAIWPPPSVALTISPARLISMGASCTFNSPHSRPYVFRIMGARASRCSLFVDGSNDTTTHAPFLLVPHSSPRSPVSQYLDPARLVLPEYPSRTLTAMLNSHCGCSACLLK